MPDPETPTAGAPDEPTDADLTELRRLHEAATPGPWRTHDTWTDSGKHTATVIMAGPGPVRVVWLPTFEEVGWTSERNVWNDVELIAAMRNALPGLLAEVERLRAAAPKDEFDLRERWRFVIEADQLDGGYVAQCIDLPGCVSQGETVSEALANIADAYAAVNGERAATPASEDDEQRRTRLAGERLVSAIDAHVAKAHEPLSEGTDPATAAALFSEDSVELLLKAAELLRAGSPPPTPAPTDDLIRRAEAADAERDTALDTLAALSAPPLWTGVTTTMATADFKRTLTDESWFDCPGGSLVLPVPPGTAVEVREKRP